jgi:alpha-amylase
MSSLDGSRPRTHQRRSVLGTLAALGLTASTSTATTDDGTTDDGTTTDDTSTTPSTYTYPAVYQYYHTDWTTITDDLAAIADAGYGYVQVPPAQQSALTRADQNDDLHPPLGYQPVDHRSFDSAFGTEDEYATMVEEAHAQDLGVIADAVMNHMAADRGHDFPAFSYQDFHHAGPIDYDDPDSVENGDLLGLPDLDQGSEYVRTQLRNYVEKYATIGDTGIDGLRYDAAKHMPEWFFERYANDWADDHDLLRFGEVLHGAKPVNHAYATTGMSVMDYPLYFKMQEDAFRPNGDLRALDYATVHDDPTTLTFVSNHDTDPPEYEKLAHAYILTQPGYPRVYNRRVDVDDDDVQTLLWIRNNLARGPAITRHVSQDTLVFERHHSLLVGLNTATTHRTERVQTSWTNQHLHDHTDHRTPITTDDDGHTELTIPPRTWVCYARRDPYSHVGH